MHLSNPPALVTAVANPASANGYIGALAMNGVVVWGNHFSKMVGRGVWPAEGIIAFRFLIRRRPVDIGLLGAPNGGGRDRREEYFARRVREKWSNQQR